MLGIDLDPLVASGLAGFVWAAVQACLDRPYWSAQRRRWLVLCAGVVLALVIWFAGAYPATWRLIAAQIGVIIGAATAAFTALKSLGVIDWLGRVTPGGEPRHRAAPALPSPGGDPE